MSEELSNPQSTEKAVTVAPVNLSDSEILDLMSQWPSFFVQTAEDSDDIPFMDTKQDAFTIFIKGRKVCAGDDIRTALTRLARLTPEQMKGEVNKPRYLGLPMSGGIKQTVKRHVPTHRPTRTPVLPAADAQVNPTRQEDPDRLEGGGEV